MPGKQIDKLRKAQYKKERLSGNSIAGSMVKVGYKPTTAYHRAKDCAVVKTCERELMNEIKASDITVEWVINKLNNELVSIHAKTSDKVRILELLGKYLNMFRDTVTLQQAIFIDSKAIEDAKTVIDSVSVDDV